MLDMGEPVRIVDLARNMIRLAGYEPERDIDDRVHRPAPRREAARGAVRSGRAAAADRGEADPPRRPPGAARLGLGRVDPGFARAPGDGRRRGEPGRAGGAADRRAGWRRGGGRLRRITSRSHFGPGHRTNRRVRRPRRVPRPERPRPAVVHPRARHPTAPRLGRLGAGARRRAQGVDLGGRRAAGRGAAQAGGGRTAEHEAVTRREERRRRRDAGLPELTRRERFSERTGRSVSGWPSRATWSGSSSSSW